MPSTAATTPSSFFFPLLRAAGGSIFTVLLVAIFTGKKWTPHASRRNKFRALRPLARRVPGWCPLPVGTGTVADYLLQNSTGIIVGCSLECAHSSPCWRLLTCLLSLLLLASGCELA